MAAAGQNVVWVCDPMHGNTFTSAERPQDPSPRSVLNEVEGFFAVHRAHGTWPGGIHIELTGDNVTECLGGSEDDRRGRPRHQLHDDGRPRLNARQSLDLAFRVAELLRG